MKIETITARYVEFMPKQLEPGILYISEQYGTAAHLCACGCGEKIRTPLQPTEWAITKASNGPSLWPSVGNWQKPCKSHYVIDQGRIIWCSKWTSHEIDEGRYYEESRRKSYYNAIYSDLSLRKRIWRWLKELLHSR